jgi:hypothetical protein
VISRYLVIALAFIAGAMRIAQDAWIEAAGLFGLGAGLAILKLARPALRPVAYVAFVITALSIVIVLLRR